MAEIWAQSKYGGGWFRVNHIDLLAALSEIDRLEREHPEYTFKLEVLDA